MVAGKKLDNNDSQIFSIPWPFLHHSSSHLDPIVLVFTIVQLSQEHLGWNTIDKSLVYTRKRNWETAGESLSPQPGAPCASQALNTSAKNRGRWCDQEVRRAVCICGDPGPAEKVQVKLSALLTSWSHHLPLFLALVFKAWDAQGAPGWGLRLSPAVSQFLFLV